MPFPPSAPPVVVRPATGTRRSGVGRTGAVAAVLAAVTVLVACGASGPPAAVRAAARRVAVVGDSLTVQARPALEARLGGAGYAAVVTAEPGRALGSDFVQGRLAELAGRPAQAGEAVVVATAANDAVVRAHAVGARSGTAGTDYRRAVAELATRFADRCVVVVNARVGVDRLFEPAAAAALDADLVAEAARWGNLVVADWATASAAVPASWFASDRLHFGADPAAPGNLPSAAAWADVVVSAVQRCAPRPSAHD